MKLVFIIAFLLSSKISMCLDSKTSGFDNTSPISINSDRLEVDQDKYIATFFGNVIVKQNDIEIDAEKIIVSFIKKKTDKNFDVESIYSKSADIDKIFAYGGVKFFSGDKKAYSDTADYVLDKKILNMRGNVKLLHNSSIITGEHLVYDLNKNQASIINDKSRKSNRVNVVIDNKGKK